jgi:Ca2+-binding RTX toxin-like protein
MRGTATTPSRNQQILQKMQGDGNDTLSGGDGNDTLSGAYRNPTKRCN